MNAIGWTVLYLEDFLSPPEAYLSDLERSLAASPTEKEAEKLLSEKTALKDYVSEAGRILRGERNPLELPPASEISGTPIPNFYILRVGVWRGYYRLDPVSKTGVGVLTLHEGHDLQGTLQTVLKELWSKGHKSE